MTRSETKKILLFDLDAVLINSAGYYRSLTETVRRISLALGFGDRSLEQADIDAFEALDITAEWDSSALTSALLLIEAWKTEPEARLPRRPPLTDHTISDRRWPDVRGFLAGLPRRSADPVGAAQEALLERLDDHTQAQRDSLAALLRESRTLERSLTFWLVQLFNLGSLRFTQTYGLEPGLETGSMLETHDRPTLSRDEVLGLLRWREGRHRGAAIVTNRPATSPGGIFNTPEAEIGVGVSGLVGVPVIAAGDLGFRATNSGPGPSSVPQAQPGAPSGRDSGRLRLAERGQPASRHPAGPSWRVRSNVAIPGRAARFVVRGCRQGNAGPGLRGGPPQGGWRLDRDRTVRCRPGPAQVFDPGATRRTGVSERGPGARHSDPGLEVENRQDQQSATDTSGTALA